MSPETLYCTSKCTKSAFDGRAVPGFAGEYAALPQISVGSGKREGGRKGRGDGRGSEDEKERGGPPLYEVR